MSSFDQKNISNKKECVICHSSVIDYGNYNNYKGIKCLNCGFVSTNPLPSNEEISAFYDNNYYHNYAGGLGYENLTKKESKDYNKKIELIKKLISNRASILEVGAADGTFLEKLKENGFSNLTGCDLSTEAASLGKKRGVTIHNTNIQDPVNNAWENQFDLVIAWATIEHVIDPVEFTDRCLSFLKHGGLFIFDTGITDTVRERKVKKGVSSWYYPPEHLHVFTKKSIEKLLNNQDIQKIIINHDRSPVWKLLSTLDYRLRSLFKLKRKDVWDKVLVITRKIH